MEALWPSTNYMLNVATSFYKDLFSFEPKPNIHLGQDFWGDSELVTEDKMHCWKKPFSEEEIKATIMGSYANGAPSPYGLSFILYQNF